MLKAVEACRTARVPYLFDPGKQTPRLEAQQILDGMESASAVIGNDYEFALMSQKTGKSEAVLQSIAPVTIVTRGEQGSTVLERGKPPVDVPVAPIKALVDPTGAGDAYLGGLVFGMARKLPWQVAGRIGAVAAAYAIEVRGCQEHRFTHAEFVGRYKAAFGSADEVAAVLR
jgi:adenosine kinase